MSLEGGVYSSVLDCMLELVLVPLCNFSLNMLSRLFNDGGVIVVMM